MNFIIMSTTNMIKRLALYIMAVMLAALSILTAYLSGRILMLAMVWNLFLAMIPIIIVDISSLIKFRPVKWLLFIAWLIFLPNTFYMLTDIMHIQFLVLETSSSAYVVNGYSRDIVEWLNFVAIVLMGAYGFYLGCHSVEDMAHEILPYHPTIYHILMSILSGIGIYIGRFLRFNTWDLIHPRSLIRTVLGTIDPFAVMFIVMMSIIVYIGVETFHYYAKKHQQA